MSRIKILPQAVANQIAAGEVVERPASAVKELVENAVDAGASRITVETIEGGKLLIRVMDNGCGMSREDVELSIMPHATSKVYDESDLERITTLGFRGEALASLGAVSELTVASRAAGSDEGWKIRSCFGRISAPEPDGMPEGTIITVENLFLEIPARRRFLKRRQTELGHAVMKVRTAAAIYPDIEFRFISEGRTIFRSRQGLQGGEALWPLLGNELSSRLMEFRAGADKTLLRGFLCSPEDALSSSRSFYFFLNGRPIVDRLLWKALNEACRGFFMKRNYPAGALFLEIEPELVDVNVHPAKHEARFRDPDAIFKLIYHSIRDVLQNNGKGSSRQAASRYDASSAAGEKGNSAPASAPHSVPSGFVKRSIEMPEKNEVHETPLPWERVESVKFDTPAPSVSSKIDMAKGEPKSCPLPAEESSKRYFASMDIKGQIASTYIVAEHDDTLILVDQHAAHEAVLFKRLCNEFVGFQTSSQPLLFPHLLERTPACIERLEATGHLLRRLGIEVEQFGEAELALKAIPSFLADLHDGIDRTVAIIDRLAECPEQEYDSAIHDITASIACSLAIKAGQRLLPEEMRALFEEMDMEDVSNCPHGRPVIHTISLSEMEKMFGRRPKG